MSYNNIKINMISATTLLTILIVGFFLLGITLHALIYPDLKEFREMKERERKRSKVELRQYGSSSLYFPPDWDVKRDGNTFTYDIRSWDAGKTWYVVEIEKNCIEDLNGIKILGRANDLYPGLVNHLKKWDILTKHIKLNGPINPNNPEEYKLLEAVNATINVNSLEKNTNGV